MKNLIKNITKDKMTIKMESSYISKISQFSTKYYQALIYVVSRQYGLPFDVAKSFIVENSNFQTDDVGLLLDWVMHTGIKELDYVMRYFDANCSDERVDAFIKLHVYLLDKALERDDADALIDWLYCIPSRMKAEFFSYGFLKEDTTKKLLMESCATLETHIELCKTIDTNMRYNIIFNNMESAEQIPCLV